MTVAEAAIAGPTQNQVVTFTGRRVDVKNPDPYSICLEDIAHGLANTCRYGGQCDPYYSVAEHAVFVAERIKRQGMSRSWILMALHHDDAEAYLGDIPRPLKPLLGNKYKQLSDNMDKAIVEALDLPRFWQDFHSEDIKAADDWAVFVEARHIMQDKGAGWSGLPEGRAELIPSRIVVPDYWMGGLKPAQAEKAFLEYHYSLVE